MKNSADKLKPVAIILADEPLAPDLQTIFGRQDLSSLMIAGNSLIEHVLMELQDLKIQECIVLARENASQIQHLIGDGRRWGMNIAVMNYVLSKEQVLREYKSLSQPSGLLIVEVDRLRSRCLELFLEQATLSEYSLLEACSAGQKLGITLLKANDADFIINAMPVHLKGVSINTLGNTYEFHRANFDVVTGAYQGIEPSIQINSTIGQRQHWTSQVNGHPTPFNRDLMISQRCKVAKNVSLKTVILNHDVYVQRDAELENTIVMPHAVISSNIPIKNAVVCNDVVYQI